MSRETGFSTGHERQKTPQPVRMMQEESTDALQMTLEEI